MLRDALANLFRRGGLRDTKPVRHTKHPGSKNRKMHKKKIRAAQKRAKMSRKRNR